MWQGFQGVSWQDLVDGATVVGLAVGYLSLRTTRGQSRDAKDAAEAAKDASALTAKAVSSRSAELQLTVFVRDMRHQLEHLERACTTNNYDVAQLALGHWRSNAVEAVAICRRLTPDLAGGSDLTRGTTAANIAGHALATDNATVQEALSEALEPMTRALDVLQASAADARVQPNRPEAGTP